MASQLVRNRYVSDGAGVVPPPRLLIMLYDRLVLDLQNAEAAITGGQLDVVSAKLCHAQDIILELHSALDHNAWAGAASLAQLYIWFGEQLIDANVKKDAKSVRDCLRMVKELQTAWHNAYEQVLADQARTAATAGAAAS